MRLDTERIPVNPLRSPIGAVYVVHVTPNGAAIRSIREARGQGLRRLAHRIDRSPGYLSRIETELQGAGDETLRRIADALNVPVGAITRETP